MKTVRVVGRFLDENDEPIEGEISFTPRNMWVEEDGVCWALLAPRAELDEGRFDVQVDVGRYIVSCPLGKWKVKITATEEITYLADHIPSRFQ